MALVLAGCKLAACGRVSDGRCRQNIVLLCSFYTANDAFNNIYCFVLHAGDNGVGCSAYEVMGFCSIDQTEIILRELM